MAATWADHNSREVIGGMNQINAPAVISANANQAAFFASAPSFTRKYREAAKSEFKKMIC